MTKDTNKITTEGAVELTEDSLDQVSGGPIAAPGFPKFSSGGVIPQVDTHIKWTAAPLPVIPKF